MDTHLGSSGRLTPRRRVVPVSPAGLLLATLLAGCVAGCGGPDRVDVADPAPADSSPSGPSRPAVDDLASAAQDAELVSLSSAGGGVDPRATVLDDRRAVARFTQQFAGSAMAGEVERAWSRTDAGAGRAVVAAVVDVSCEAPAAVEVREGPDGVLVEAAAPATEREIQCLVPVTTVAVLAVPADAV